MVSAQRRNSARKPVLKRFLSIFRQLGRVAGLRPLRPRIETVSDSKTTDEMNAKAVALSYEPDAADAPRVVAKGKGAIAERILEIAFAAGVKVREDADLVEILQAVDLDSEIPVEAFRAVAEILAYVYRANGTLPPRGAEQ